MGQYYYVVNLDKATVFTPHCFGDGLKAIELSTGFNTMRALALLLTKSDEGGGGDFKEDTSGVVGSWAGDRIWIVGDYDSSKMHDKCGESYEEMSPKVIPILEREEMYVKGGVFGDPKPILRPDVLIMTPSKIKNMRKTGLKGP